VLALTVSAGAAAFSCSRIDFDVLPIVALSVADAAVVTAATLAVNVAEVAVAGTVTELGTVTEPLLLARPTVTPPVGAEPESVTVHESARDPVMDVLPHASPLTVGTVVEPVPLRLTLAPGALLAIASWPVTDPAAFGLNWTDRTNAWPGFKVSGKLTPETEKPVPEIESALIDTATLPFDVRVIDFVTAVPTETFPNASEVELRVREAVAAFSFSAKLFDEALAAAVRFTVWVALTEEMFAVKDADDAPAGTVTLAGRETALVLLASVMP